MGGGEDVKCGCVGVQGERASADAGDEGAGSGALGGADVLDPEGGVVGEFFEGAFEDLELAPDEGVVGYGGRASWDFYRVLEGGP